jgi:hypothetical protein
MGTIDKVYSEETFNYLLNRSNFSEVKAGIFEQDFRRTCKITLTKNSKELLRYTNLNVENENFFLTELTELREETIRKNFLTELRAVKPALETAIKAMLHQEGPFYTGRNIMQYCILGPRGITSDGHGSSHEFVIEVGNKDKVLVKEIIKYDELQLTPTEDASGMYYSETGPKPNIFSELEQKTLGIHRARCIKNFGSKGLVGQHSDDPERLVLNKPLSLTITYELRYIPEKNKYDLLKLSEDNIDVPEKLIEKLVFGNIKESEVRMKFENIIDKIIAALKRVFIAAAKPFPNEEKLSVDNQKEFAAQLSSDIRPRI